MNEITQIHLGRQPFTISVAAHQKLKSYLADIKKVADKEVVDEVELRMSELLTERGITNTKVVLPEDIDYLMEQLGTADTFVDDAEPSDIPKVEDKGVKRLFRDTDNALLGGVSAGLASYSGLDVVLIRIIFVVLAIFGSGVGIVLYIVLWLIVPPAETASEKLQMQGKPVTLEALKQSVNRADVSAAAQRFNNRALPVINSIFRLLVKLIGLSFILVAMSVLIGVAVAASYLLLHGGQLFQENIFPVGIREHWLVALGLFLAAIVSMFLVLIGVATFIRRWPVRGWITGLLAGLFLLGSVAALALSADIAPRVHERYEAGMHTTAVAGIQPFNTIETHGIDIEYFAAPNYAANYRYFDHPDLSKIKSYISDNTLHVDATALENQAHCSMPCLFPRYNLTLQVYAPNIENFKTPPGTDIFYSQPPRMY